MKRLIFGIFALTTLILITESCKKKNLVRDQWTISLATDLEDGTNITSDYAGELWEFNNNGNYSENNTLKGTWVFLNGKENLIVYKTDGSVDENYTIKKLKKNTMILEIPLEEEIQLSRYK
ncbi:hypothetical protein JYT72_02665 [Crocinitomix catalasitica]|nr:hypothetical protein [Crocinitomix catalasitica]